MAVSVIQPTQSRISFPFSPMRNYNVDPAANLQIFGFRGYVCDKCLTPETHYVAFPNAEGQGRIDGGHSCDPAKVVRQVNWLIDSECLDLCMTKFQR